MLGGGGLPPGLDSSQEPCLLELWPPLPSGVPMGAAAQPGEPLLSPSPAAGAEPQPQVPLPQGLHPPLLEGIF